jgi:Holliday junction resolvase RusA-like endonuclease
VTYSIVIPGKPMTWARAKSNFHKGKQKPRYFTDPLREAKMGEVAMLWQVARHPRLEGPLELSCVFIFDRPKSHFNAAGALKPQFRHARPGRGKYGGDLDNLVKLIQDALNTVAYQDDAQIADYGQPFGKRYATGEEVCETRVSIRELTTVPDTPDESQLTIEVP